MKSLATIPQNPASAVMTRQAAARLLPHPSGACVRLAITESQAAKIGLSDKWKAAQQRKIQREARTQGAFIELESIVSSLLSRAESEQWSQRQLAAKINIPERTFRRVRDRKVNPLVWLPRVQAAANKLTATNFPS